MHNSRCLGTGALAGFAGGLIASWVMNQFQAGISKMQPRPSGSQQSSGEPATVKAAVKVAQLAGLKLEDDQKSIGGEIAHYAMGAVSGAAYGVMAEMAPGLSWGFGSVFGAALWLIADETAVPLLKLSKGPGEYPVSSHAYALASHLVYGVSTDLFRKFALRLA